MWAIRLACVSSLASLLLLVWFTSGHGIEPAAAPPIRETGTVELQRVRDELRAIAARLDELRAGLMRGEGSHLAIATEPRAAIAPAPSADGVAG